MNAREFLEDMEKKAEIYFGEKSQEYYNWLVKIYMDDHNEAKPLFDTIKLYLPNATKILDMGSGCGTFVFYGFIHGYDMYGIDPSLWKLKFNRMKAKEYSYPPEWINRFIVGKGENMPFQNNFFDCVSTYQSLEHVQDLDLVLKEMMRVTKSKGGIHIKCPEYLSTFEGHYLVPWLPLFPKRLAKTYLSILKKPIYGLNTLQYTTRNDIIKRIYKICKEKPSWKVKIFDVKRIKVEMELKRRRIPRLGGIMYLFFLLIEYSISLFRRELSCDLFIYIYKI